MKLSQIKTIAGLFTLAALVTLSAQAQDISHDRFTKSYKEACTKQQVQLHANLKEISANSFSEYCDCATRQLMTNLSPSQIAELTKGKARPTWLKSAELAASKACIKEGPGIRA